MDNGLAGLGNWPHRVRAPTGARNRMKSNVKIRRYPPLDSAFDPKAATFEDQTDELPNIS